MSIYSLLTGTLIAYASIVGVAYASGTHSEAPDALHPVTQIGLPDSALGHGESVMATSGLSREEVSALVADTMATEERRSIVKFILLSLFIFVLIWLFYTPRPPVLAQAPPQSDAGSTTAAAEHNVRPQT